MSFGQRSTTKSRADDQRGAAGVDPPIHWTAAALQAGTAGRATRGGESTADGRLGRWWSFDLPDRALLVAVYWRTSLAIRQVIHVDERAQVAATWFVSCTPSAMLW